MDVLKIETKYENDASPDADPPSFLEKIPTYSQFYLQPELYERIHIYLVGVRPKKGVTVSDLEGIKKFNYFGYSLLSGTVDPLVVAEAVGNETGGTDFFDIHQAFFPSLKNTNVPLWDLKDLVISKKGEECTNGLKITMYDGRVDDDKIIIESTIARSALPEIGADWQEFILEPDTKEEAKACGDDLEFVVKLRVTSGDEHISSRDDLANFLEDSEDIEYTEEIIGAEEEVDNALLQCWRQKQSPSSKAVLWILGRNDCFMHPHVAKGIFTGQGYDLYVLNYSCDGLCRQRGWMKDGFMNSHNRIGNFDLYLDQIEGALSIIKKTGYEKSLGYAHSTGGPVLFNYLIERGDEAFDGFVFNSPFLDWAYVPGDDLGELFFEHGFNFLEKMDFVSYDYEVGSPSVHPSLQEKVEEYETDLKYLGRDIAPGSWYAKLWSCYYFDFRGRPIFPQSITCGFAMGVSNIFKKIKKMSEEKRFVTHKPFLCITSKQDDTLTCDETLTLVDMIGPSRCEVQLRHNAHDIFLSSEEKDTTLAINMTRAWMISQGFE